MKDHEKALEFLEKYENYLDSQIELVENVRKDRLGLEGVFEDSLDVQNLENELQADINRKLDYFYDSVNFFLTSENLTIEQEEKLMGYKQKILSFSMEVLNPALGVKYYSK